MKVLEREYTRVPPYERWWCEMLGIGEWRLLCDTGLRSLWHIPSSCNKVTLALHTSRGPNRWKVHMNMFSDLEIRIVVAGTLWGRIATGEDVRRLASALDGRTLYLQCEYVPEPRKVRKRATSQTGI